MKEQNLDIPLETYFNTDLSILTVKETKDLILKCDLIWFGPKNIIQSRIPDYINEFPVYEKAGKKGMLFGLRTLTANEPYNMLQAEVDLNNKKHFKQNNSFISFASRFHRIFKNKGDNLIPKEYFPLSYIDIPTGFTGHVTCPAYQINPNVFTLVILGVDQDSPFTNSDVPWHYLTSE